MAVDIFNPFISYNNDFAYIYPAVGMVSPLTYPKSVERYDTVGAGGTRCSYLVGSRSFIRAQFEWQSSTLRTGWETFWDAVKGGSQFVFHEDDSYAKSGTGTCGTGTCGTLATAGVTDSKTQVVLENTDFTVEPMDIVGYWRTPILEMRVVV